MKNIKFEGMYLTSTEEGVRTLNAELLRGLDKRATMKERSVVERKREAWFKDHVKLQKRVVRPRERVWPKYKNITSEKPTHLKGMDLIGC
jgi:hypothetical protein